MWLVSVLYVVGIWGSHETHMGVKWFKISAYKTVALGATEFLKWPKELTEQFYLELWKEKQNMNIMAS